MWSYQKDRVLCILLLTYFLIDKCHTIHVTVTLRAPRYVLVNGTASLECLYDVDENSIHKVEWLRGGNKIYQYIKGRNPPYNNFSIPGAEIDWLESDKAKVSLKNLQFDASGVYTCEVTTDNPIYTKASEEEYLTVMQTQETKPHINFNQDKYIVGEVLDANCTSSPATPVPELTWLLNGKKADENWIRSHPEWMKSSSMVQLTKVVTLDDVPKLEVTCLSTIPGFLGHDKTHKEYADYRKEVINLNVAVPPTEAAQTAGIHRARSYLWNVVWTLICGWIMHRASL